MRKFYPGITIFKFAGAIMVLLGHALLISLLEETGSETMSFVALLTRVIVPCFYVIAGFLAYKGWSHAARSETYLKRYLIRIAVMYSFFCLLFTLQHNVSALLRDGFHAGNLWLQAKIWFMAVFVNGPYYHLWFIPPLLFGVAASYWLIKNLPARSIVWICLAGFVLCQFTSGSLRFLFGGMMDGFLGISLEQWNYLDLVLTQYIGFGLTFVAAGAVIAKYEERFLRLRARRAVMPLCVLIVIELAMLLTTSDWTNEYKLAFTLLPLTILLFYGVLRMRSRFATVYHRQLSLFSIVTYLSHALFMQANDWVFGWKTGDMLVSEYVARGVLTIAECILLTYVIYRGIRRRQVQEPAKGARLEVIR
ncbi:acyltransferase [Paenibacillus nanensis]|uniref:Acyltransferase n=1 Tax=Paenibacillus nanensis TaxID=393251 RepID=A0A3A1UNC7_9BACL|nr:acyltransferase [Paenibacillus nanensis]RIX49375.1 acyltransferase [Paenibacillus nanensis]